MAGHPTLGTAFVLARAGRIPLADGRGAARFEEGVGTIPVALEPAAGGLTLVTMTQRSPEFGQPWGDRRGVAEALSADEWMLHPSYPVQVVSCGVPFLLVPIRDLESIRRLAPRTSIWLERLQHSGATNAMTFTLQTTRKGLTAHCRMFAPALGVVEDPATGSAAGPLGCYFVQHGLSATPAAPRHEFTFEQGQELGRPSLLRATIDREGDRITQVRVSGTCVPIGAGQLEFAAALRDSRTEPER
jgi:trans-2,3-dihydro-3-hydroxyanthranilate isomerase